MCSHLFSNVENESLRTSEAESRVELKLKRVLYFIMLFALERGMAVGVLVNMTI